MCIVIVSALGAVVAPSLLSSSASSAIKPQLRARHESTHQVAPDPNGSLGARTYLPPAKQTLWKWLSRAVREGLALQDGSGKTNDPYRYSLPGMIEKWQANFLAEFTRQLERDAGREAPAPPG